MTQDTTPATYFSSGSAVLKPRMPEERELFVLSLDGVGDLYEVTEHNALGKSSRSTRVGQDGDMVSRVDVDVL